MQVYTHIPQLGHIVILFTSKTDLLLHWRLTPRATSECVRPSPPHRRRSNVANGLSKCAETWLAWAWEVLRSIGHIGRIFFEVNRLASFVGRPHSTTNILVVKAVERKLSYIPTLKKGIKSLKKGQKASKRHLSTSAINKPMIHHEFQSLWLTR